MVIYFWVEAYYFYYYRFCALIFIFKVTGNSKEHIRAQSAKSAPHPGGFLQKKHPTQGKIPWISIFFVAFHHFPAFLRHDASPPPVLRNVSSPPTQTLTVSGEVAQGCSVSPEMCFPDVIRTTVNNFYSEPTGRQEGHELIWTKMYNNRFFLRKWHKLLIAAKFS